jgi:peptide/nickel transport system substrate-binding protein
MREDAQNLTNVRAGTRLSRRRLLAGAAAGAGLIAGRGRLASAAPRRAQSAGGDAFTPLLTRGLPDLDPHSAYDGVASSVIVGPYETLVKLMGESTKDYAPGLAESWEASADGREWTFAIPKGVTFHDGTACDAEAVVASFHRFLQMAAGPVDVIGRFVDSPDDVTAVDATRVKFRLKDANPLFLAAIASQYGPFVVSPAAVEAHKSADDPFAHEWLLANMVGTGPYRVVELSPSERVVLERFDAYHGGWEGNHFARVAFRVVPDVNSRRQLLEHGDADALVNALTPEALADLKTNPALQVLEYQTTCVDWATFNSGGPLSAPDARKGLSYAFPYDEARTGVMKGLYEATGGPLAPLIRGYDPSVFVYRTDLDRAKMLLDGAVHAGATFSWSIAADNELSAAIAQLFQANLQKIGYDLDIQPLDRASQIDMAYGDAGPDEKPDAIGDWSWFPDYDDAYNQMAPNFHSEGGSNIGFYKNDRIDAILAEMAPGVVDDRYTALAKEAQNILTEQDPPAIFMGAKKYYTVLRSDIRGFVANPVYLEGYNLYDLHRAD